MRGVKWSAAVGAGQAQLHNRDAGENRGDQQKRNQHHHQVQESGHVQLGRLLGVDQVQALPDGEGLGFGQDRGAHVDVDHFVTP